jgi:transcriptional regulator with XRE-family HTH domain
MTMPAADPVYERFLRDVGRRIQSLREERRWTPQELAKNSGLTATTVLEIEAGKTDFTMDTVVHFANAFNIKIAEIVRRMA